MRDEHDEKKVEIYHLILAIVFHQLICNRNKALHYVDIHPTKLF